MKAQAKRNKKTGQITVTVTCQSYKDERIIKAIANSTWIGTAINASFDGWNCPFYAALKDVADFNMPQCHKDTQILKRNLYEFIEGCL